MEHPPEALQAFLPLSPGCAMRAGGLSQRGGAALARRPSPRGPLHASPRRFHAVRATHYAMGH